jgi:hypothetical protein
MPVRKNNKERTMPEALHEKRYPVTAAKKAIPSSSKRKPGEILR